MSSKITVHHNNIKIYDIVIQNGFDELLNELKSLSIENRKICIVSDTNVARYYLEILTKMLKDYGKTIIPFVFEAGEINKNLNTVNTLYETLIKAKFDRKDLLIALGGGVVGDLTGFAAATYLRGIDFIQIPTSLLSQVDSSIGGKTGVDFNQYKNMVGAFYHPKMVYINLQTLNSLPKREFLSGMAEVVKHGLIKDFVYYEWLKDNREKIKNLEMNTLEEMIFKSCMIKKNVVEKDFYEQGDRALLNFGHTIGHAVEKLADFKLLHGECVSIGIFYALHLSYELQYISKEQMEEAILLLKEFDLPINYSGINHENILDTILLDKKIEFGVLKFIVLKNIGHAIINRDISIEQIKQILLTYSTQNELK